MLISFISIDEEKFSVVDRVLYFTSTLLMDVKRSNILRAVLRTARTLKNSLYVVLEKQRDFEILNIFIVLGIKMIVMFHRLYEGK